MKENVTIPIPAMDVQLEDEARSSERLLWRSTVFVTLAFWLSGFFAVTAVRAVLDETPALALTLLMRFCVAVIGCGFCYVFHLVLRHLDARPFWQRALALALITPFVADAFTWINFYGLVIINPAMNREFETSAIIYAVTYWVWFFMAWGALYLALRYSFQVKEQERRWRTVQALAHAAQLRALRNQISPHFLFNTLNSISSLILDRRSEAADAMVMRLSEFFRISLAVEPLEDVRLDDELRLQRHYLEIERARFPDLTVAVSVPTALLDALVPTLILQPIVENAIKYAIAQSQAPATIEIEASAVADRLRLKVTDDGAGSTAPPGAGIGLANVRGRLANRFGDDFVFEAGPKLPRGFVVVLEMPLRFAA